MDVTEDGLPFLVMELLEGEVLTERLASPEPLPVDEALRLIDQLLDVLDAAHTLGIVHRDIKPDNLIVLPGGRLKVIDFGVAQLRGDVVGRATPWGMRLGTVGYMAPEQARGEPVDARADLFGVGATLLRMVAGPPIGPPVTRAQQLVDLVTGQFGAIEQFAGAMACQVGGGGVAQDGARLDERRPEPGDDHGPAAG